MLGILKWLLVLLALCAAGFVAFAYLGDLSPTPADVAEPIGFDANAGSN